MEVLEAILLICCGFPLFLQLFGENLHTFHTLLCRKGALRSGVEKISHIFGPIHLVNGFKPTKERDLEICVETGKSSFSRDERAFASFQIGLYRLMTTI